MRKFFIILVLIIIVTLVWQLLAKKEALLVDETFKFLTDLKTETGIEFSEIADVEFKWVVNVDPQIKEETVSGKGFEANVIPSEQFDSIHPFLIGKGFETDVYNHRAGTISGSTGYIKNKTVCTVAGGLTGYKEAEGQWIPTDTDNWDITIKCGNVEKTKIEYATEDWQVYQNEKYGYSFKYPEKCLLGPLPGECKQSPPEERAQECLCYLNNTNPDGASLGTYTGTKSDLTGASFIVFHSIYVDRYNPPANTDLVEWLKENFSQPVGYPEQDIPDETNAQVGGLEAVKIYTPFSGMAWSQEDIFFIKDDKLFRIGILDVDNENNRELYDQILSTFEFFSVEANCTAKTGESMGLEEAKELAVAGECEDQLKETYNCNSDTGTWWIDLDVEKEGCYPACVVNVKTKAVSINWRCTGVID